MKAKERIFMIGTIAYLTLYAISGVLGYYSLIANNDKAWPWCVGILTISIITHLTVIAAVLLLEHIEKKERKK